MNTIKVYSESLDEVVDMELSTFNYICKMQKLYAEWCDLVMVKKKDKNDIDVIKLGEKADKINAILNSRKVWKEWKRVTWVKIN